ncbi:MULTISPECIES: TetR/AcrR family transcriptional regulator [Actinomyces]|uniref:TetR/AcrR family transcriptional regulator n=2 Tax=Actinomyces TaxID=1654 RepID=A0A853ES51_9ACTO|nr:MULTISPECIES: TetR/AcrR family transcriptional regulator [Actinomyces]MBF0698314.1 TetR/AcrR family transcriptional regulator [Actinomyces bowdenii]MCR2051491.1 TetR/AcrR family transcriptional regulator [Actinomyces bowdenii]MDO5064754.1 TetR/AcrR family transcriptional regulator [Actinomyces bowdenii]NYS70486.1 TetR/AcrR family transcriptional regulator [Actinomyces bowdenii]BDA64588.1 TetR family transcriptional regulator [Actinomyces capricornis]
MPKIMGSSLAEHRERTRTALFSALSELMSQRSFDKITLSDVATHAGVGRTAVYNHFADKEDLLLAFMEHEAGRYAEELSLALAGTEDPIDRLRIYVRQQALIKRHYHFPTTGPLADAVSRGTAGRLRAHGTLMAQMLSSILTEAMDQGLIPPQDPSQVIPLLNATIMGGRPTPSEPEARKAYLESLDAFVLRAVGAALPAHGVPEIPRPYATEPVEGQDCQESVPHTHRSAAG